MLASRSDPVEITLAQFSNGFTVSDIMTPVAELIRADSLEQFQQIFEEHSFDVVPTPRSGPVTKFYYLNEGVRNVTVVDLISDGTSLLDALSLLAERRYYFVLSGHTICGYLHFSDLNKPLIRTALYVMMEATERHLLNALRTVPGLDINLSLRADRIEKLKGFMQKAAQQRADTSIWDVMGLPDVLDVAIINNLARVSEVDQLTPTKARELVTFRNSIAHSGLLLVSDHAAVARLVEYRQLCMQLRNLNNWG